jgi:hypothetical protein
MAMAADKRLFISFAEEDLEQVKAFEGLPQIGSVYECYNHHIDPRMRSQDSAFKGQLIKKEYIEPSLATIVLVGKNTAQNPVVKWEIEESKRQKKPILAIRLPGVQGEIPAEIPQGHIGSWQPEKFIFWIDWAVRNRGY